MTTTRIPLVALGSLAILTAAGACKRSSKEAAPATTAEAFPLRSGSRPQTSEAPMGTALAHQQLTQNAPAALQDELIRRAAALEGVALGETRISVAGARAFHLEAQRAKGPREAFMAGREFAHVHPPEDGSLHLRLPPEVAQRALAGGWGERHPRSPSTLMVYGPRDAQELEVVWRMVRASYEYARGAP